MLIEKSLLEFDLSIPVYYLQDPANAFFNGSPKGLLRRPWDAA